MSSNYQSPIRVTIPVPCEIPRARGAASTGSYGGNMRIRCTTGEYDLVQEEAEALGLGISGFCRWVITHSAKALREHRLNQLKSIGAGEDNDRERKKD